MDRAFSAELPHPISRTLRKGLLSCTRFNRKHFPAGNRGTESHAESANQLNHTLQVEGLGEQIHQVHFIQPVSGGQEQFQVAR